MLDKLKKEDFSKCLHQKFLVDVEGRGAIETELVEVHGLLAADDDPDRRQPFSLIFRGPEDTALQQGIFHLENETMGELDLFLVTIGSDKEGQRYEAVFT